MGSSVLCINFKQFTFFLPISKLFCYIEIALFARSCTYWQRRMDTLCPFPTVETAELSPRRRSATSLHSSAKAFLRLPSMRRVDDILGKGCCYYFGNGSTINGPAELQTQTPHNLKKHNHCRILTCRYPPQCHYEMLSNHDAYYYLFEIDGINCIATI